MKTSGNRPLSPDSPSIEPMTEEEAFARYGDVTQGSTSSIEEVFPQYGITWEDAKKLNQQYNQETVPRIQLEQFWELVIDVAKVTKPAEVEATVATRMEMRSVQSRTKFNKATFKILLSGPSCFEDAQQQSDFGASLSCDHAIHEYEALVACLPPLVEELHDLRAKMKMRGKKVKAPKQCAKKSAPRLLPMQSSASDGVSGRRRSPRLMQAQRSP